MKFVGDGGDSVCLCFTYWLVGISKTLTYTALSWSSNYWVNTQLLMLFLPRNCTVVPSLLPPLLLPNGMSFICGSPLHGKISTFLSCLWDLMLSSFPKSYPFTTTVLLLISISPCSGLLLVGERVCLVPHLSCYCPVSLPLYSQASLKMVIVVMIIALLSSSSNT